MPHLRPHPHVRSPLGPNAPRRGPARALPAFVALLASVLAATGADAQYFGRNKVQYEAFDFRILETPHFGIHHYPEIELPARDAGRMAERWYARLTPTFGYEFRNRSIIFYADQPDFQQTNVISGALTEGTGGVTEGARTRVIMPFTGVYADNDHVLGHELVHVYQYGVAEAPGGGGLARLGALPLWLIEGMAEYMSLGRNDPNTAMWMRDAVRNDRLPTIDQLTRDPSFFPYRYGQALWAYLGGRFGDPTVVRVYRASLRYGFEGALRRVLGLSSAQVSREWHAATRAAYEPVLQGRTAPDSVGERVLFEKGRGALNVAPALSPDGRLVAFFSGRGVFSTDLYVADARTGRIIKRLASPTTTSHLDAISYIYNSGTWSPDGSQFAFVAYAGGDNELNILDVRTGRVRRRIRPGNVGAISSPAWSPDGRRIAFSGSAGGISDLYLLDLGTGRAEKLTDDREADLQPAWSPDGRTLAWATDRGPGTDFSLLTYAPMRLALIDVETRAIRPLPLFEGAKHLNPQFSPDGRDLYFLSTQDGFQDVYRATIATGEISRVTRVATGVSGITYLSPALTVAQRSGRMMFSVFERQGYNVYALDSARTLGAPITPAAVAAAPAGVPGAAPPGGVLPPPEAGDAGLIARYLRDPRAGLPPADTQFGLSPYRARLHLDGIAPPTVGVATSRFGTAVGGGIAAQFSDQLGNHMVGTSVQASGQLQDIGGQLFYLNSRRRWNYGAEAAHVPYITGGAYVAPAIIDVGGGQQVRGDSINYIIQRTFIDRGTLFTQYPFSTTRRFELSGGVTRLGYSTELQSSVVVGNQLIAQTTRDLPSPDALTYFEAAAALVGDNSYFAFTSPVAGWRYRVEVAPVFGGLTFYSATADFRRYFQLPRQTTFAIRGIHFGRYGRESEVGRLRPLYLGEGTLVRGYGSGSFRDTECSVVLDGTGGTSECPEFDRLIGHRVGVANVELRIPLIGNEAFGLINIPFLPVEVAPFVDAGVAWSGGDSPRLAFDRDTPDRVPVFSAGVSTRINVLGYAVVEAYYARPFQRPSRGGVFGFNFAPGW